MILYRLDGIVERAAPDRRRSPRFERGHRVHRHRTHRRRRAPCRSASLVRARRAHAARAAGVGRQHGAELRAARDLERAAARPGRSCSGSSTPTRSCSPACSSSMGSLGDRIGRRRLLLIGSIGFGVVSVAAAFAPSAELADRGSRAALGFFGAMLMPSTLSLLRSIFVDRDQRRLAIADLGQPGSPPAARSGRSSVGSCSSTSAWGSVFLLAVPVLLPLARPRARSSSRSRRDPNPGRIDVAEHPARRSLTMVPLVFASSTLAEAGFDAARGRRDRRRRGRGVLFVRRQLRREHPDARHERCSGAASFSGAVVVNLLSVIALVGLLFFVSQHLQLVLGPAAARRRARPGARPHRDDRRRPRGRADRPSGSGRASWSPIGARASRPSATRSIATHRRETPRRSSIGARVRRCSGSASARPRRSRTSSSSRACRRRRPARRPASPRPPTSWARCSARPCSAASSPRPTVRPSSCRTG